MSKTGDRRDERGFTLLELLVVMAIVGLVVGVVATQFTGIDSTAQATASARDIAAGLRSARSEAIATNRDVVFTIDVENRRYSTPSGKAVVLPDTLNLALYTASSELADSETGGIRFFTDGSSTGGHIRITVEAETTVTTVAVDWLTGNVSIQRQ